MTINLVTIAEPGSPVSEAYRSLRTNLSFYSVDKPIRTLVVTSPAAGAGKSVTVANLAVTIAQSGRRTVLVDCDLRRPSLHTFFELQNEVGLTDAILDEEVQLELQDTGVENLWFLASGLKPPNPADLLGSQKTDRVITKLMEQADMILFDAPPVIGLTDAIVLGAKVDGVLLVLKAGKTRREHAQQAKELLEMAKVNIVGATLTNAPQ